VSSWCGKAAGHTPRMGSLQLGVGEEGREASSEAKTAVRVRPLDWRNASRAVGLWDYFANSYFFKAFESRSRDTPA
jgi:hypothetical protein